MTPKSLDDVVGQGELVAPNRMLRRMIETDRLSSIILFGPSGTGKTSIARVIATTTKMQFWQINAVTSGVADIKRILADTQNPLLNSSGRAVLFVDEIHRFNKSQQDALLPHVEDGTFVLIGATTENPFFEVNKALLSRSNVFQLQLLTENDIITLLNRALHDCEDGFGNFKITIDDETLKYIARLAQGDARHAYNTLELAVLSTTPNQSGEIAFSLDDAKRAIVMAKQSYDGTGEEHYDTISAFIKSMRGSDPDATIYYLAKMLVSGESIEFIARRIVIAAAEDVGLANPDALVVAETAFRAVTMIGMPEARIVLAEAALVVATSPKSNSSYLAIDKAIADVKSGRTGTVPYHLRNAPAAGMVDLGYGKDYVYPHSLPHALSFQRYLPEDMGDTVYYNPNNRGYENRIKEWLDRFREQREANDSNMKA